MSTREDVLRELREARAALLSAIDGLSPDQMRRPEVVGVWSVKDVLAHITAWESELIAALNDLKTQRAPRIVEIEDIDEWNEEQYHATARRPLEDVLADFEAVHRALLAVVEGLDNRQLGDNRVYPWMEGEPLAYLIAENATLHEQEHADDIRAWREQEGL